MKRSTTDLVVIILSASVGSSLILGVVGLLISRLIHPEVNVREGAEFVGNIITTIVGALVGFIGGRATGKAEANGHS